MKYVPDGIADEIFQTVLNDKAPDCSRHVDNAKGEQQSLDGGSADDVNVEDADMLG